ncbi:Glycosyltransferase involved in cell wall bisynthesis [Maribacter orientalis]|uniref:Glycosyltransferase involved in cell wall bisynthesis n=1 Tax=Maribacter orientalis TaxID=228957 RepID=A0A1H7SHJ1_9FLAO|nr:glycosyltransferase family 4 protein [Maribacter orientalis]SEL71888.1 Glycosyltransferase involved in cell wall bisynthesis [Maribacter orientalis]
MKIDIIIGSLKGGGAERVVSTLANYFDDIGYEVRIFTFSEGDRYPLNKGIIRKRFHKKLLLFNYALIRALVYLIQFYRFKENRPNIICSHINFMAAVTIPLAKLYDIKVISSEHSNHKETALDWKKKIVWNFLYKYADAITVLTKYDLEFFKRRNKNVWVMHNPNSFQKINKQIKNRDKSILAIGDLNRYLVKGFDNLIDIAFEVNKYHPDWKFKIVGEGDEGKKILQDKVKELNLTDTILFTGYRSDIDQLLQHSSIFILCSRNEGMPMALIEATSQGIACIAYDCVSGPSDIIENKKNGVLVANQNKQEMSKQLMKVIEDEEYRNSLGNEALKTSVDFSIDKIGSQWETLFKEILKIK